MSIENGFNPSPDITNYYTELSEKIEPDIQALLGYKKLLSKEAQEFLDEYCQTIRSIINNSQCEVNFSILLNQRDNVAVLIDFELKNQNLIVNFKMRIILFKIYNTVARKLKKLYKNTENKGLYYLSSDSIPKIETNSDKYHSIINNVKYYAEELKTFLENNIVDKESKSIALLYNYELLTLYHMAEQVLNNSKFIDKYSGKSEQLDSIITQIQKMNQSIENLKNDVNLNNIVKDHILFVHQSINESLAELQNLNHS